MRPLFYGHKSLVTDRTLQLNVAGPGGEPFRAGMRNCGTQIALKFKT